MIDKFNDVEIRPSGIIYNSMFEQIKKMHEVDSDSAGELAISVIELVLTGQISSDNPMIDMMLTPAKVINQNNVQKYEVKKENSRMEKANKMKLPEIAELLRRGAKQREIAERLGLSQQTVSYRAGLIRTSYPDLLQDEGTETAQTNSDVYQNTNGTKNENLVNFVQKNSDKKIDETQLEGKKDPFFNF